MFAEIAGRKGLVRNHHFDRGDDGGPYYNFTFGTEHPVELWRLMRGRLFDSLEFKDHMAMASMAMLSDDERWDHYIQLHHWDSDVKVVGESHF